MKENNKGITLVALVITIIVLLILAGVTVASLSGENGLLTRGSQAVSNSNISDAKEKVTLAFDDAMSEYYDAKYVTNTVTNQTGGDKYTAVAFIASRMLANPDFTDNARFLKVSNSGSVKSDSEVEVKSVTGSETELVIQLTEVKAQDASQNDKAVIETKLVGSGNAAKLQFDGTNQWKEVEPVE